MNLGMSGDDTTSCSICLNPVGRSTRINPPIRCGHRFHRGCIERWKQQGNNTCPMCRKVFDVSKFRVILLVENLFTERSSSLPLDERRIFNVFDRFELHIPAENDIDLASLLGDIEVSLDDLDGVVLEDDDITNRAPSESREP